MAHQNICLFKHYCFLNGRNNNTNIIYNSISKVVSECKIARRIIVLTSQYRDYLVLIQNLHTIVKNHKQIADSIHAQHQTYKKQRFWAFILASASTDYDKECFWHFCLLFSGIDLLPTLSLLPRLPRPWKNLWWVDRNRCSSLSNRTPHFLSWRGVSKSPPGYYDIWFWWQGNNLAHRPWKNSLQNCWLSPVTTTTPDWTTNTGPALCQKRIRAHGERFGIGRSIKKKISIEWTLYARLKSLAFPSSLLIT